MSARLLCTFLAGCLFGPLAESCGVLVHNELVHRSTHLFAHPNSNPRYAELQQEYAPLLSAPENSPAVQAGAFFPDWGYQCMGTDDDAEAAHWPPFLIAAVEHITSKYGYVNATSAASRSPAEQAHLEGLIAFVFAIASHQTADATWHAIRLPTGLLAALTGIDFAGDGSAAHHVLDLGGDLLAVMRLRRMDSESMAWLGNEWKVPISDLVQIYERMGHRISSWVLRYCTMRGLVALSSELAVGPSLYPSFAAKSPMLLDEVDGYYLGGMDEMVARTVNCWANLTMWFSEGIDEKEKLRAGWGICDVFQAIYGRGGAGDSKALLPHRHGVWDEPSLQAYAMTLLRQVKAITDEFGAETYSIPLGSQAVLKMSAVHELLWENPESKEAPRSSGVVPGAKPPELKAPSFVATYTAYGHLGSSLVVGNFAPAEHTELAIAVGAPWETEDSASPGEGGIYVIPASYIPDSATSVSFMKSDKATSRIAAAAAGAVDQRFGTALAGLGALNKTLICVSAPGPLTYDSSAPPSLPFVDSSPAGRIDFFAPGEVQRLLSISLKGAELGSIGKRWWGENMLSADLDGSGEEYLIVSGSRSDGIRTCEGRRRVQFGEGLVLLLKLSLSSPAARTAEDPLIQLRGDRETVHTTDGITVDSYAVSLPESEKSAVSCEWLATYEQFGASLAFAQTSRTLFVGAPGASGLGKVFAYKRAFKADTIEHLYTITPDLPESSLRTAFGGGGMATGISASGQGWLAVGAHNEDVGKSPQAGVVYIFSLPSSGDKTTRPELIAELVASSIDGNTSPSYAKFGKSLVADGKGGLWIGAPGFNEERGAVWWVSIQSLFEPDPVPIGPRLRQQQPLGKRKAAYKRMEAEYVAQGEEPNAHFGSTLAIADLDGNGKPALIVGIPESGVSRVKQDERFHGAFAVFRRND